MVGLETVIGQAQKLCQERGVRLTAQRQRVLEILCASQRPLGAYEILEQMGSDKPPTVYRALEFLLAQGLAHRIESLNAFVGCSHPEHPHASQFLICRDCGVVSELEDPALGQRLDRTLASRGFQADSQVVEITGRCASCLQEDPDDA